MYDTGPTLSRRGMDVFGVFLSLYGMLVMPWLAATDPSLVASGAAVPVGFVIAFITGTIAWIVGAITGATCVGGETRPVFDLGSGPSVLSSVTYTVVRCSRTVQRADDRDRPERERRTMDGPSPFGSLARLLA